MSTLKVTTIQNLSGTEVYTAKAWVNFNGTGTVAIRASGNVSSITDNGAGDYTVNFTTALADANYSFLGTVNYGLPNYNQTVSAPYQSAPTTTAIRMACSNGATIQDQLYVYCAIFR
jgi:hypothetical protein